ncbi:15507_t:CDS:2, partial [Entrophospora sp. SA101]
TTFATISFDWIETHSSAAKITKSADNSGIVLFDSKGTRLSDDQEIWQMEVAGPPWNPTTTHTINDTKKTFQSDILNLVSILRNNLDCSIDLATKIKVFCTQAINGRFLATELASAIIPFSWSGRSKYKVILLMMSIFHEELTKQEELMEEISLCSSSTNGITVRQVLRLLAE